MFLQNLLNDGVEFSSDKLYINRSTSNYYEKGVRRLRRWLIQIWKGKLTCTMLLICKENLKNEILANFVI